VATDSKTASVGEVATGSQPQTAGKVPADSPRSRAGRTIRDGLTLNLSAGMGTPDGYGLLRALWTPEH